MRPLPKPPKSRSLTPSATMKFPSPAKLARPTKSSMKFASIFPTACPSRLGQGSPNCRLLLRIRRSWPKSAPRLRLRLNPPPSRKRLQLPSIRFKKSPSSFLLMSKNLQPPNLLFSSTRRQKKLQLKPKRQRHSTPSRSPRLQRPNQLSYKSSLPTSSPLWVTAFCPEQSRVKLTSLRPQSRLSNPWKLNSLPWRTPSPPLQVSTKARRWVNLLPTSKNR